MKNLKSPLFQKFEMNRINNLAKVVGGTLYKSTWKSSNGSTGCDITDTKTKDKDGNWDFTDVPCEDQKEDQK